MSVMDIIITILMIFKTDGPVMMAVIMMMAIMAVMMMMMMMAN